jgi:hypothetical protein
MRLSEACYIFVSNRQRNGIMLSRFFRLKSKTVTKNKSVTVSDFRYSTPSPCLEHWGEGQILFPIELSQVDKISEYQPLPHREH